MNKTTWDQLKQGALMILLGGVFSLVPFYFNTMAMTKENKQDIEKQTTDLKDIVSRVRILEVDGAVDNTEIRQINLRLERIEKKIDRLIDTEQ
jgi:hypothetical protein